MEVKPGYYTNISNDDYHSGPGISKSHLDEICVSPLHYWARYIDPDRQPERKTPALILGDAIDKAILEPDLVAQHFAVMPEVDGRTKEGKEVKALFMHENAGKTFLSPEEHKLIIACRDAVHRHPVAGGLLRGGQAQAAFYAIDPDTGELIKCKTDMLHNSGMVVDLKTTEDASPDAFAGSLRKYRYFVQEPWYRDTIKLAVGEAPQRFVFVAVEKKWPHAIGVYFVPEEDVGRGRAVARRDLLRIHQHKQSNTWPDYGMTPVALPLPDWSRRAIDNEF